SPYDLYPTSGRAIFLAVGNDRQFRKMCEVLGEPELGRDPRFATNADRLVNRDALDARLKPLLATHDGLELAETLMNAGVPAGAALSVPDVYAHPHTLHRGMFLKAEGYKGTGTPIKFGRTPGRLRRKPPKFGADGRAVLREAGFAPDKIEALAKAGVLVEKPGKSGD
ncbi:MAG: CoA transferase, partial [Alphaproteobacteria bacterium]|nr:CoA transferase [Alphaproteobacteria bacterium]